MCNDLMLFRSVRGVYDKLCKELKLPEWHLRDGPLFSNGLTHILPAFFNLLIHLQNQVY